MLGWARRHWLALAGFLPLIPPATKGVLSLLSVGGNIDFVISRSQEPGWVGQLMNWLIDPPSWMILPLIALGLTCIYWDAKRQPAARGTSRRAAVTGIDPASVQRSPDFIRLRFLLDPQTGSLSPENKIQYGEAEFNNLFKQAMKGDVEAYYLAGFVAEWVRENARKYWASSVAFHDVELRIVDKLSTMSGYFKDR
jgi:hypothetical protein